MTQLTPEELAAYQDWSELDHEGNDDGEAVYRMNSQATRSFIAGRPVE